MSSINFCKFNGFGNDYIVIEKDQIPEGVELPDLARAICSRHTGAGSDGIAVVHKLDGERADFYSEQEIVLMGVIYAAIGVVFFLAYTIAIFLPPKPYNWIVGIVMMAISMTSCCFVPFALPLIIFWVKPETRAYFGRN